ncbi:hypothetical protein MLD38_024258 [Melastoma candidum]|uniref:Uncharacterized protein n=1 Tax=Melastoma candidum TaxID=119954 RepID=A0ACB9NRH3_9MYRT|nr:hypothetical protein MLD38_024258 [Melastoma candidum]
MPLPNMGGTRACRKLLILLHLAFSSSILLHPCVAETSFPVFPRFSDDKQFRISLIRQMTKLKVVKNMDFPSSNTGPYGVSSPFTLPPYDSISPIALPDLSPPFCIFPPFTPQPPYTPTPTTPYIYFPPVIPIQNPPPSPSESFPSPYPPKIVPAPLSPGTSPSPPIPRTTPSPQIPGTSPSPSVPGTSPSPSVPGITPSPSIPGTTPSPSIPRTVPSPPTASSPPFYFRIPPAFVPSPPSYFPSPGGGGIVPSPPIFHPPIVYPAPTVPPPPQLTPSIALWCVAKPSVPDPIIQEAMNYACGSGADCSSIQPEGSCFQPNTLFAHASYAFNSYWQRTKVAGGSCSFGGTAMLVTVDPTYDGCHFEYY